MGRTPLYSSGASSLLQLHTSTVPCPCPHYTGSTAQGIAARSVLVVDTQPFYHTRPICAVSSSRAIDPFLLKYKWVKPHLQIRPELVGCCSSRPAVLWAEPTNPIQLAPIPLNPLFSTRRVVNALSPLASLPSLAHTPLLLLAVLV
jgi:hypothetical protein